MGLGNVKPNTPASHRCTKHSDRYAAVGCGETGKCWECYLEPKVFKKRFRPEYYDSKKPF